MRQMNIINESLRNNKGKSFLMAIRKIKFNENVDYNHLANVELHCYIIGFQDIMSDLQTLSIRLHIVSLLKPFAQHFNVLCIAYIMTSFVLVIDWFLTTLCHVFPNFNKMMALQIQNLSQLLQFEYEINKFQCFTNMLFLQLPQRPDRGIFSSRGFAVYNCR